jgi:effector-binding domain-containing protein
MLDQPRILQTDPQLTALIHLTIPREEIRDVMGPGLSELMATIAAQNVAAAGPWFNHHRKMDPEIFDFEISVPVASEIVAAGRVQPSVLPAATVARTIYRGPYEDLGDAWSEFTDWIIAQGHEPAPNLWECYVAGPESNDDPATWQTELNRPLVR